MLKTETPRVDEFIRLYCVLHLEERHFASRASLIVVDQRIRTIFVRAHEFGGGLEKEAARLRAALTECAKELDECMGCATLTPDSPTRQVHERAMATLAEPLT